MEESLGVGWPSRPATHVPQGLESSRAGRCSWSTGLKSLFTTCRTTVVTLPKKDNYSTTDRALPPRAAPDWPAKHRRR